MTIITGDSIAVLDPASAKYAIATDNGFKLWISEDVSVTLSCADKSASLTRLGGFYSKFSDEFIRLGVDGDLLVSRAGTISVTATNNIVTILHRDLSTTEIVMSGDYKVVDFDAIMSISPKSKSLEITHSDDGVTITETTITFIARKSSLDDESEITR